MEEIMNYEKIYNNIISKAQARVHKENEYYERHHIIPKFMGGGEADENLVPLTPKEHFICHLLLTKFVPKDKIYAAVKSVYMMLSWSYTNENRMFIKPGLSKTFIKIKLPPMPKSTRKKISEATKRQFDDPEKRKRHLDAVKNRFSKQEELDKLSVAQKKRFTDDAERKKISESLKEFFRINGCANKGRSFAHLSVEERKRIFGRKKKKLEND